MSKRSKPIARPVMVAPRLNGITLAVGAYAVIVGTLSVVAFASASSRPAPIVLAQSSPVDTAAIVAAVRAALPTPAVAAPAPAPAPAVAAPAPARVKAKPRRVAPAPARVYYVVAPSRCGCSI